MSHAPSDALSRRHRYLRARTAGAQLDALVITAPPNVTYVSNFTGSSAVVVLTPDRLLFLTDSRYVTAIESTRGAAWECPDLELVTVDGSYDATLAEVIAREGFSRTGFEAAHVSVARLTWLESALATAAPSAELVPVEGWVEGRRVIKDAYEIGVLREAGRRLSDAAGRVLEDVRSGMAERDVAWLIETRLREAGFSRPAFETIVASGPNAALPHARPTERILGEGDLVVLDFGGVYDSYCVDLTRTVAVGAASSRSREVHQAVLEAHDLAIAAVMPGQSRFAIDAAARDALIRAELGEAFGHGTGHGLGIEIHEDPRISRRRPGTDVHDEFVAPGMVFTIEPGAYLPGWGGVRIEDDVLVTDAGGDLLTHVPTALLEID
jgi:Xaa-Pro aminopeptidase